MVYSPTTSKDKGTPSLVGLFRLPSQRSAPSSLPLCLLLIGWRENLIAIHSGGASVDGGVVEKTRFMRRYVRSTGVFTDEDASGVFLDTKGFLLRMNNSSREKSSRASLETPIAHFTQVMMGKESMQHAALLALIFISLSLTAARATMK